MSSRLPFVCVPFLLFFDDVFSSSSSSSFWLPSDPSFGGRTTECNPTLRHGSNASGARDAPIKKIQIL